jgi:tRNA threonylcarbamoyladenosine biosynthesis protein TsaB
LKLLAIETATAVTRVALLDGECVVAEVEDAERAHAAALLPAVERALADAALALSDVEGFAVSIGPGSFTGLRIGLATVKAFSLGGGRPTAAVPSLAALAWPHREKAPALVACLDAQRGEIYAACYRAGGVLGLEPLWREVILKPEELAERVPEGALLVGTGTDVGLPDPGPRAGDVGALGSRLLAAGAASHAAALVPRYVRRAEAEARRLEDPIESHDPAGELL